MTKTSVNIDKNERNGHLKPKAFDLAFSKALLQVPHKLQNCLKVSYFTKTCDLLMVIDLIVVLTVALCNSHSSRD